MAIKIKKKDRSDAPEESEELDAGGNPSPALAPDADPFLRASWDSATWVEENRATVFGGIALVLVAVIGGYFGLEYLEKQKVEASTTLSPAFESYNTLIEGSPELEAINQNPDIEPPENIAKNDKERWGGVYASADEALTKHPNVEVATAAKLVKAAAAVKLDKNDEAISLYDSFLNESKDKALRPVALQGLATAYASAEKWDKAVETLDTLGEVGDEYASSILYQKARVLERAGKSEDAKKLYHEVLDTNPNHPEKTDIERRLANM